MKLRGRSRAGGRWRGSDVKQRGGLEELKPTRITSEVSMEEPRLNEDVENVNPVGGLREQSRRKLGLRTGLQELRSKDRAGVLAPNPTLGNGGGAVDALEWLKDRVSQHRLASECQPQPDSGSRRHQRLSRASGLFSKGLGTGVVAGREQSSVVSHPLPSQSASSIQSRNSVDRLDGATKNQQVSGAVQAGAKSPWGATTRGALHIYEDDTVNSQGQRDSSRRELNIKSTDTKLQGTPSLVPSSLAGAEIEEQSQVSLNAPCRRELTVKPTEKKLQGTASSVASGTMISMYRSSKLHYDLIIEGADQSQASLKAPSNVGVSKFEFHYDHDEVCVKQLSPQASTHSESSSGIWRGSKVRGTPYRQTLQHSRSSPVDQPEMGSRDQHFSSNGQATGLNLIDSKNGRSSVTPRDRQELAREAKVEKISPGVAGEVTVSERRDRDQLFSSREQAAGGTLLKSEKASSSVTSYDRREISSKVVKVSAVEKKSRCAAADTVAELASRPQINQNFPTKLQELKFRIQQQTALKSLDSRKSANSIGNSRWSPGDEQDSLYSYALPMPEKMGVSSSSCMEAFQCKGKNSKELVSELENDGADFSVDLSHVSPQPHLQNGEQNNEKGPNHKIGYESRTAMCEEEISKNGGNHSEVRANQPLPRTGTLPPLTEPQIAVTVSAGAGSSMWSRSSAMSRNQIGDGYSPPDHVSQDGGTKWTSTNNMDSVGPDSALLASEVTGASSSGSSATPCVMGNSSLDDVTQKSCGSVPPSPAVEKALSSYNLNVHQPRRAKKPSRSLGPPGRVLRTDLSTCNSRISPACAIATVIESGGSSVTAEEEVAKNGGQLEFPGSDQRKRKAERDLGNGDTSLILEHGSSVPANLQEKNSEGGAFQAQWQLDQEPREMGSMPSEPPSASVSEENVGEAVDMSYTGFSAQGNKENVPMPLAVPHLSNGVCSLSLGGEDVPNKDESKVLPINSRSPVSSAAPTSQVTVLQSVENCRAPLPASHPERPVISVEKRSCDAERISPSTSGSAQANEFAESVPSNSAEDSGGSAQQSAPDTGKDIGQGATTTSQTKKFENSHFVWVNNERYQKLGKVGKGGSSEVFKVIDRDCNIYALKKISLKGRDHRAALGFYQEIEYLEMLRGKGHVVQLIAYEVTDRAVIREDYDEEKITEDAYIYMILEFGEIDLAGILTQKRKEMMDSNQILDDNWLLDFKFYWKHMLLSVKTIHDERIVHADLKPANFLLVKGKLKLIDFGIAKAIQNDTTHIVRDSQVGTLNYMSPEAFMANSMDEEGRLVKCGRASDIWSLGCILYQMVYGHTPFSKVTSFYAKIQAITSKNHKIEFPPIKNRSLLDVMQKCLTWDRTKRPQITELLEHPFLRSE